MIALKPVNPPIEEPAGSISLLVKAARFDAAGNPTAQLEAWNGSLLHTDSVRLGLATDRDKYARAVESRSDCVDRGLVDKAMLKLAAGLAATMAATATSIDTAQTQPVAALTPPTVELLDESPAVLARPLAVVDGRGYAVTWAWARTTMTETRDDKTGKVVKLAEPHITTERRLFVVRDDGVMFGEGGDEPIEAVGLTVQLSGAPRDAKLWSAKGVKAYRSGYRPDARDVFGRVVGVVDRFLSFDRSLADQRVMCELVACYALSTWFLSAFDVAGFLWPNGGYGCGKTKLGLLVCEIAYLGEALLAGSTYACLRDLADLGATLLFDDAEGLADAKKADPDKRNLLLAGNRRGTVIAVKEPKADGTWGTRYVNGYCARMFTAIRLPDPVLASRSIVVPLVRTGDPRKANAEVLDYGQWPTDQRGLLDDLWGLALANLAAMPGYQARVNTNAPLVGRNLEPWRALLSVALWLDDQGEDGLYQRMSTLAQSYQTERADLETTDFTRVVARALIDVVHSVSNVHSVHSSSRGVPIEFDCALVVDRVNAIAVEDELFDDDEQPDEDAKANEGAKPADAASGDSAKPKTKKKKYASRQRVGWVLTALRIKQATRTARGKRRQTTLTEVEGIADGYSLPVPWRDTRKAEVQSDVQSDVQSAPPPEHYAHYAQSTHSALPDGEAF